MQTQLFANYNILQQISPNTSNQKVLYFVNTCTCMLGSQKHPEPLASFPFPLRNTLFDSLLSQMADNSKHRSHSRIDQMNSAPQPGFYSYIADGIGLC